MAQLIKRKQTNDAYYAPKKLLSIDLAQDLSDHAAELLWGQGFSVVHKNEYGNARLQELIKYNLLDELLPYNEKLLSLTGNTYVTIDMVAGKPTLTIADPNLNSMNTGSLPGFGAGGGLNGIGRAFVSDMVAVVWKKITFGTYAWNIKEVWDTEKVVRYFYNSQGTQVTLNSVNKEIPEDMRVSEVWEHNLGFVPVVWFKNVPTFNALSLPDGYKGHAPQALVDKTLSELWHETETNRTRIIGNLDETTYNQLMKNGALAEINKNDFLINVVMKNSTGADQNALIPIVADPKFEQYWLSIQKAKDEYYQLGGYSPLGDGSSEKTATENLLMKTNDYQTTKKKRNQRLSELTKLFTMLIAMDIKFGIGNIYVDAEDFSIEIMENKVMDSINEITNIKLMVDNLFMSNVEAIAKIRGITKTEAQLVFDEILAEQKKYQSVLEPVDNTPEVDNNTGE